VVSKVGYPRGLEEPESDQDMVNLQVKKVHSKAIQIRPSKTAFPWKVPW